MRLAIFFFLFFLGMLVGECSIWIAFLSFGYGLAVLALGTLLMYASIRFVAEPQPKGACAMG